MKRIYICICLLMGIFAWSCSTHNREEETNEEKMDVTSAKMEEDVNNVPQTSVPDKLQNAYFISHEDKEACAADDHVADVILYFKITERGECQPMLYGTTDDFDEDRYGYIQGYIIGAVEDFTWKADSLSFNLNPQHLVFWNKPISVDITSQEEVFSRSDTCGYKPWRQYEHVGVSALNLLRPAMYQGIFSEKDNSILLTKTIYDQFDKNKQIVRQRVFKMIDFRELKQLKRELSPKVIEWNSYGEPNDCPPLC